MFIHIVFGHFNPLPLFLYPRSSNSVCETNKSIIYHRPFIKMWLKIGSKSDIFHDNSMAIFHHHIILKKKKKKKKKKNNDTDNWSKLLPVYIMGL